MKKNIQTLIASRKFEDIRIIRALEKILVEKRGYVFRMPAPKSEVILLVSGGLDSILTWGLLLERYKLIVYPLFLNKGERRKSREEASVDFFSSYYAKKYPEQYVRPVKQTVFLPQKEILTSLKTPFNNLSRYDKRVTRGFNPVTTTNIYLGSPGVVPFYAMIHARNLELNTGVKIRSIFSSVMMGDGIMCPSQTITSLRTINLAMCTFTGDYTWQFTSPAAEPHLPLHYEKSDLVRWGAGQNIPMEQTWSCYRGLNRHCGKCLACAARIDAFRKAKIPDKTAYSLEYEVYTRAVNKLRRIFGAARGI